MPDESDPLRDAAARLRIQKLLDLRRRIRDYQKNYLILWILGAVVGVFLCWPLTMALILLGFFSVVAVVSLSIIPFVQFTLRGLFLCVIVPQLAVVLLKSKHDYHDLLGCVVLTIWITAMTYFFAKIKAASERFHDEQAKSPTAPKAPQP